MSDTNSESNRDWRVIAEELSKEKEQSRISKLARELTEALDRKEGIDKGDLRRESR